jgi:transcription initiation factor TFIIIB Brf1 subunit/transcription initiation factor TFIIB
MKTYQSTTEGTWIELKGVQLTKEQRDLLRSRNEADKDAQAELSQLIKSQREGEVESSKVAELTSFYNTIKPADSNFQLISIDLSEKEDKFVGILNCRINGEHKQVRF